MIVEKAHPVLYPDFPVSNLILSAKQPEEEYQKRCPA